MNANLKKHDDSFLNKNRIQLKTVLNLDKNLIFKEKFFIDKKRTILLGNLKI